MRTTLSLFAMLLAASLFITGCGSPDTGANNASNKATNATNVSNANTGANAAAIETDIKKQVADMAAALQKGDSAYFEKLYTDNYMFVGPDGSVASGKDRIASMKSGQTKYETITYDDVSVRSNAEGNGAVSISIATVKGVNLGKPVDGKYRVTHVWSKTKDGWRLASGQTTPITAAATSDKPAANANAAATGNSKANSNSNK